MCDREKRMTREEVERIFYQLDTKGKVLASLLMDINDNLEIIKGQNEKLLEQNEKLLAKNE